MYKCRTKTNSDAIYFFLLLDKCSPLKCKNDGKCAFKNGNAFCNCTDRFTGKLCETDVCSSNPCKNGGTCDGIKGKYVCKCSERYGGPDCETDKCSPLKCKNGGKCAFKNGNAFCNCTDRFTGKLCETELSTTEASTATPTTVSNTPENQGSTASTADTNTPSTTSTIMTNITRISTTNTNTPSTASTIIPNITRISTTDTNTPSTTSTIIPNITRISTTDTNTPSTASTLMPNITGTPTTETNTPSTDSKVITNATRMSTMLTTPGIITKIITNATQMSTSRIITKMITNTSPRPTYSSIQTTTTTITIGSSDSIENVTSNSTTEEIFTDFDNTTLKTTEEVWTPNITLSSVTTPTELSNFTTEVSTSDEGLCKENPCKNGGTCLQTENGQKCVCPYPYGGDTCTSSYWCTEGLGKVLCETTKCMFDFKTKIGRCSCSEGEFYDYSKRACQPVDTCPLTPGKCKDANQVCRNNQCQCKENFKRNKKNECIPNFCQTVKKDACGVGTVCMENDKDPENVKCVCDKNHIFNGKECVKVNKCDIPGVLRCQQICNATKEACGCLPGYELQKDRKTCNLKNTAYRCTKDCKPGVCYKDRKTETCLCPSTHVLKGGACKDLCTAGAVPKGLCPGDVCEPHSVLGFKCKCSGSLTYDENKMTCRRKLKCSEGGGQEACAKRSAKCAEDLKKGFRCECPDDKEMDDNGICKNKCELEKYRTKCLQKMAICDMEGSNATCKCPPLLTFNDEGVCTELAISYTGDFPFYKNKYSAKTLFAPSTESTVRDFSKMQQDLRNSMHLIYGKNYKFAQILNCSETFSSLICTVELQFESDPKDQIKLIGDKGTCIANGSDSCFIPPELVLEKKKLTPDLMTEPDPCMDSIKQANCGGKETVCSKVSNDSNNFVCSCADGFLSYGMIYPVTDPRTIVYKCQDEDECKRPAKACPNRTRCMNTYGSYECLCETGYRPSSTTADPKVSGCTAVCSPLTCGNGVCELDGFYYKCRCNDGYSGDDCKQKLQMTEEIKGPKIALIALSTIVIPLALFGAYMVHKYRILMKKVTASNYLDDSTSISMDPLRPIVR